MLGATDALTLGNYVLRTPSSKIKEFSNYEDYVQEIYSAILNLKDKGALVTKNATLFGRKSQTQNQIDVYCEYLSEGITHIVAIECIYAQSPVEKTYVTSFYEVIQDIIGDVTGVIVSKNGYHEDAKKYCRGKQYINSHD